MKPGDALKKVLSDTWGIPTCGACHETAKRMNELGVDGCREHLDELAEQLHRNAKNQKWTSLIGAAVRFVDGAAHAVSGNAMYRKLIVDVCDFVENTGKPCVHRGEQTGSSPWNKALDRYYCRCEHVHEKYCIVAAITAFDQFRGKQNDIAICSNCKFNQVTENSK